MNETMNALVNLTICPRSPGTEDVCTKCSYKNCGDLCCKVLVADSSKVLMQYFTEHHAIEKPTQPTSKTVPNYRVAISDVMRDIGVPANVLGYEYLREAIKLTVTNSDEARDVTKWLYPTIAIKYNTTASRVERAIRHAIEVVFDRGDCDVLIKYFGNTINVKSGKLKNTELIFGLADYIKIKCSIE